MTDLLTHVLVAYLLGVALAETGRLPERFVPVVMVGATAPDAMKAAVLLDVPSGTVAGVPYSAWGLHTLGGVLALSGLGALTLRAADRRTGLAALVAGGASHLLLDLPVVRVDGVGAPYLFPLSGWLPPAGNLYTSSDVWPLVLALAVTVPVWLRRRRRSESSAD